MTNITTSWNNLDCTEAQRRIAMAVLQSYDLHGLAGDVLREKIYNYTLYALRKELVGLEGLYATTLYIYDSAGHNYQLVIDTINKTVIRKAI